MMESSVVLPQPEGPGDGHVLALGHLQVHVGEGVRLDLVGEEHLLDGVEREEARARGRAGRRR
jgi:hypothetical protein